MTFTLLISAMIAIAAGGEGTDRDDLPGVVNGPSREEVAAMVRTIGRDTPTDELIDQALSYFRPRCVRPARSFEDTRRSLNDPVWVGRFDQGARDLSGEPASTLLLVEMAATTYPPYSEESVRHLCEDFFKRESEPVALRGKLVTETGEPVRQAIVTTPGGLTTTDDQGRFSLGAPRGRNGGTTLYFEASGFALGETTIVSELMDTADDRTYTMWKPAVCDGLVFDDETKAPIADAEVSLWIHHRAFDPDQTDVDPQAVFANRYITLCATTDAQGRYAFRGLPPKRDLVDYAATIRVTHPRYLANQDNFGIDQSPRAGIMIPMTPGASVSGYVTDPEGHRLPNVTVNVLREGQRTQLATTATDDRGEFQIHNLAEGEVRICAEPDGLALGIVPASASRSEPVWLKLQVGRGEFIEGRLIGPDGTPASHAQVGMPYLLNAQGTIDPAFPISSRKSQTDDDGHFKLGPLSTGRYRIYGTIQKPEYYRIFVDVATGQKDLVIGRPQE